MYLGSHSVLPMRATNKTNGTDLRHRKESKFLNGVKKNKNLKTKTQTKNKTRRVKGRKEKE